MAETIMGELTVWSKQLWIVFGSVAETTESELAVWPKRLCAIGSVAETPRTNWWYG